MKVINDQQLANIQAIKEYIYPDIKDVDDKTLGLIIELCELAYFEGKVQGMAEGIKALRRAATDLMEFLGE